MYLCASVRELCVAMMGVAAPAVPVRTNGV